MTNLLPVPYEGGDAFFRNYQSLRAEALGYLHAARSLTDPQKRRGFVLDAARAIKKAWNTAQTDYAVAVECIDSRRACVAKSHLDEIKEIAADWHVVDGFPNCWEAVEALEFGMNSVVRRVRDKGVHGDVKNRLEFEARQLRNKLDKMSSKYAIEPQEIFSIRMQTNSALRGCKSL